MKTINLTLNDYREMEDNYEGVCVACGAWRGCTEPDARNYPCDDCGEDEVYGPHELLFMDSQVNWEDR